MFASGNLVIMEAQRGVPSSGGGERHPRPEGWDAGVKEGRRRQEPRRGGVSGATGVLLGTEQGFVITQRLHAS